ncbi:glycosyltransferase [Roseibium salinum]|uniref:Glycosyltransferase n=2 Tax=Roseibium salinum TaxID=1604349 RepID=A0ABT3QWP4_9HYPH|nr:glycosyltransferase [Roseibium sp. DSM 29163]MCX2721349.1 glycosyltransferase [Roseibium sp. DSM 29163]
MLGHLIYLAALAVLAVGINAKGLGEIGSFLLVLGAIGMWRYSWAMLNFLRALYYTRWRFPRLRRSAERDYARRPVPAHAFFMVTTYKIEASTTARVYRSIIEAAARSPGGATVVASVVDGADVRAIGSLFARARRRHPHLRLLIDQIPGTGKRDAMARALRLIAREAPSARDVLVFVDGDSCVPPDLITRTAPFFTDRRVGALTTDEAAEIPRGWLFRSWFALRFMQRQMMMSSMALGGRVLTLTGRLSVFRADLATNPDFVRQVQHDYIEHWRLGHVNFLTGDDKSTWFWLLARGYRMSYVPDVRSLSMETQPRPGFVDSAVALMRRWFGNMLRTNGRALSLGPARIGMFTWWSILDQRLSIWTTLAGPIAVLIATLFIDPIALPAYLAWVMFTRYLFCAALSAFRGGGFPIVYVPLLYFSQIVGAAVKSYVLFRQDRQKWTRQSADTGTAPLAVGQRLRAATSTFIHVLALGWLTLGVTLATGVL